MAKQTINIGTSANDGTGSNLRAGGTIINANFTELYTALGTGSAITLTATPTELNLLTGATAIVTNNNTVSLTNKNLNSATNTFPTISIRDDASSAISISLGGTLKLKSNDGITTTVSGGDTVTISLDNDVVTETSTDILTNKTLTLPVISSISNSGTITIPTGTHTLVARDTTDILTNKNISTSTNTISGLTNTNLSGTAGITNANIANPFIQFSDESSTVNSTPLGGKLEFLAGEGINTTVGSSTLTISAELATSVNAGVATFNTASFAVSSGDVTIKALGVSNAQLVNSAFTLGSTSTSLGGTTSSVAGLSLTGSANTIDLTSSGNKLRFNFANTGSLPTAATYAGMFATTTGTAKAFFADSGGWNEIISENSSIKSLSDVGSNNPTNGQVLIFNSTTGLYQPGTIAGNNGTITSIVAGTGLSGGTITTSGTISIDSSVVTTTGTQTLSAKTINTDNNTISNIRAGNKIASGISETAATIDVTDSGGFYNFNSHYSGASPTLYLRAGHTYALNLTQGSSHPLFLQTVSGGYSSGNGYTTGVTHVSTAGTVTTGSFGAQYTGTIYIEVPSNASSIIYYACQNHSNMTGKIVLGSITDTFTGDGSTTTRTINSGRNVNDVLVIVNGIILVPTTDYTISTTTLTFSTAPAASAEIQVRYL